jgi:hypothetical protein
VGGLPARGSTHSFIWKYSDLTLHERCQFP